MLHSCSIAVHMSFKKIIIIICISVCMVAGLSMASDRWAFEFVEGDKPINNPYKGFAAWSENYRQDKNIAFAYVPVYWSELEKEEGVFDFESLELKYHFDDWTRDGVYIILRVVMDTPSGEKHADLPEWLLNKIKGTYYDTEYGRGFSPDYADETLISYHELLIKALAERYADDSRIAFIELGSLGHWGEWHIHEDTGKFINSFISDQYVQHYLENFDADMLMLRRPYDIGKKYHLGLYNDSFSQDDSHNCWLDWIENGYISDQNGEYLSDMKDFWKYAPSGGEFASDKDIMFYFSDESIENTVDYIIKSHTTFLGPNIPAVFNDNVEKAIMNMGYCFSINDVTLDRFLNKYELKINLCNDGVAPIYKDLDMVVKILDSNGDTVLQSVIYDCGIKDKTDNFSLTATFSFDTKNSEKYELWLGFKTKESNKANIELANSSQTEDCLYFAGEFVIK